MWVAPSSLGGWWALQSGEEKRRWWLLVSGAVYGVRYTVYPINPTSPPAHVHYTSTLRLRLGARRAKGPRSGDLGGCVMDMERHGATQLPTLGSEAALRLCPGLRLSRLEWRLPSRQL